MNGDRILDKNHIGPTHIILNCSEYSMATLLGTSSPKTRLKYASMIVTTTLEMLKLYGIPYSASLAPSTCEILFAAKAEDANPANVMATWIVDKNLVESPDRLSMSLAFLLPSSASFLILILLTETTAISDPAKNALISVRITKTAS